MRNMYICVKNQTCPMYPLYTRVYANTESYIEANMLLREAQYAYDEIECRPSQSRQTVNTTDTETPFHVQRHSPP